MTGKPFVRFGACGLAALLVCSLLIDTGFPFALLFCVLCLASAAALAVVGKGGIRLISTLAAAGILLGGFYLHQRMFYMPSLALSGTKTTVSGIVISAPQKEGDVYSFTLDTTRIDLANAPQHLKIKVISLSETRENERFSAVMKLKSVKEHPELRSKEIFLIGYAYEKAETHPVSGLRLRKALDSIRSSISGKFSSVFDMRTDSIARALLLGDRSGVSERDYDSVRDAGGAHLLAVSGLHLSLLTFAVFSLLGLLRVPVRLNAVFCCFFVLFYMALLRFAPAVTRAGIMAVMMFASIALIKELDPLSSLGFAVTVMLLVSPFGAADPGFLLSVSAAAGIIITSDRMKAFVQNAAGRLPGMLRGPFTAITETAVVSAAASIAVLPVSTVVFGTVSTMSIPTSLLMTPLIYVLLPVLALCAALPASGFIPQILQETAKFLSDVFFLYTKSAGSLKYSVLPTGYIFLTIGLTAAAVGLAAAAVTGTLKKHTSACLLCALLLISSSAAAQAVREHRLTEITVYPNGSGSCVLIRQGDKAYLVGAGADSDMYAVRRDLTRLGIRRLEALILPATGGYSSNVDDIVYMIDTEKCFSAPSVNLARQPQNYFSAASLGLYSSGTIEIVVSGNGFYIEIQHDAGSILMIGGNPDFVPILDFDICMMLDGSCKKPDIPYNCLYTAGQNTDAGAAVPLSDGEKLTISVRSGGIEVS